MDNEPLMIAAQGCLAGAVMILMSALAGTIAGSITGSLELGILYGISTFLVVIAIRRYEPYMIIIISLFWPVVVAIALVIAIRRASAQE